MIQTIIKEVVHIFKYRLDMTIPVYWDVKPLTKHPPP